HPTSSSISSTDTSTSKIYTLSLHDALPIFRQRIYKYQINIGLYFCIIIIIIHLLKALYYHPEIPLLKLHSFCRRYTYYLLLHLRSEEHTSELQSRFDLVCRLLLEKKNLNIY